MKQSLEEKIRELGPPSLSEAGKERIKNSVFSSIRMTKEVRSVALETEVDVREKIMILERLREFVANSGSRFSFSFFRRQFAASLLIMLLVVGGFSFVNVDTNVVFAAEFTQLVDVNGAVIVERDGKQIDGYKGMELYEKDKVLTNGNAFAVVRFFDDSISRLSPGTILKIEELNDLDSGVSSYVQIELEDGQVWSKVVSLVTENSAFVVKGDGIWAEAKKGAFNLLVNKEKVELGVFSNEVKVTGEKFKDKLKVVTGQKLVTNKNQVLVPKVFDLPLSEKNGEWAKSNIADDQRYVVEVENRLIVAKMKSVGLEVNDDVLLENSVREDALKFLTFSDVDKQKLNLDLAEKKFVAAQIKLLEKDLSDADRAEAQQAIQDFYLVVREFYAFADDVATTDLDYGNELRKYAQDKVLKQKKLLSSTLPDSPYYFAKDVISKIELIGVEGVDLAKIKQDQAHDKLVTIEEVVNKGDLNLATQVLGDYQKDISDVITILDTEENVDLADKNEIIQNVKDSSVMLQSIDDASSVLKVPEVDVVVEEDSKDLDEKTVAEIEAEKEDVIIEEKVEVKDEDKLLDTTLNFNFQIKQNLDFSNLIIDGPFGVQIQGDKPLDPLL